MLTAFITALFLVGAGVGLVLCLVQWISLSRHTHVTPPRPTEFPGISILKPLCGIDDDLERNIAKFATLSYPDYELLLGVRDEHDLAYPIACEAALLWPTRVRVLVQHGEPGCNPKVNQLITLARAARHPIVVVSDSNVRAPSGYLEEIAAHFQDPGVGLVTSPVVGIDEETIGSLLDAMHLASGVGASMITAKRVAGKDFVVGKSMALRASDLRALGGFRVVADVLAEDYVLGRMISSVLGKRVVMAHLPVLNVSRNRSIRSFVDRYRRWNVLHRKGVGTALYALELILNPVLLATIAFAISRKTSTLLALDLTIVARALYDASTVTILRGGRMRLSHLLASPLKDMLLGVAWIHGLCSNYVSWRGNSLRVLAGTRLAPLLTSSSMPPRSAHPAIES